MSSKLVVCVRCGASIERRAARPWGQPGKPSKPATGYVCKAGRSRCRVPATPR